MGQKRYAYLIGANGPHTERLHSLKYAEKDAEHLAKALQGSRCAFQVKWMKAIEADVVLEGLEEFSQQCESSDQLVVHFSGHGFYYKRLYLLCNKTNINRLVSTA